jgi:hypothetical protein
MLWWLRRASPANGLFPSDGVSFLEAKSLYQSFSWLTTFLVLGAARSPAARSELATNIPVVYALDQLYRAVFQSRPGLGGVTLQQVWDASDVSKLKFMYQLCRDVDSIIECYHDLVRPAEQPQIFFPCTDMARHSATRYCLFGFYTGRVPSSLTDCVGQPTLTLAVHTIGGSFAHNWTFYCNKGEAVLLAPPSFVCASRGSSKTTGGLPAKSDSEDTTTKPPPTKKPKTEPSGKEPVPLKIASTPLFRFCDEVAQDKRSARAITDLFSANKDLIPRVLDADGRRKEGSLPSHFCLLFLTDGLGCRCVGKMVKRFAHVDISKPEWTPKRLSELQKTVESDVMKRVLLLTDKAKTFFGTA